MIKPFEKEETLKNVKHSLDNTLLEMECLNQGCKWYGKTLRMQLVADGKGVYWKPIKKKELKRSFQITIPDYIKNVCCDNFKERLEDTCQNIISEGFNSERK